MNEIETNEKTNNELINFKNNSLLVRISFIIGLTSILLTLVVAGLVYAMQPNPWFLVVIYSIFIVIGLVGTITGSIALKEGKNVYAILGFLFSIVVMPFFIYVLIVIASLITQL